MFESRRSFLTIILLLIFPVIAVMLISNDYQSAQAYPPPQVPTLAPYPNPPSATQTPAPPVPPPPSSLTYQVHLPIFHKAAPILFGIVGATTSETDNLIPDPAYRIDGYAYDELPNSESIVQLFRACDGNGARSNRRWCWIANGVRIDHLGQPVRSNLAAISTPKDFPPLASSFITNFGPQFATDKQIDVQSYWKVSETGFENPIQWLEIDLHPAEIDSITLIWSTYHGDTTYATEYEIQYKTATSTNWQTLVSEPNGDGGVDTFSVNNGELIEALRLYMTQPADPSKYYAVDDLEVTGFAPDPLFQIGTDITTWAENNPGRLWFIGNEPDNFALSFGDGLPPATYAEFYGRVATLIETGDPTAQIVFCQGTRAISLVYNNNQNLQFPYRDGPGYCGQVIDLMPATLASLGSPYTFNQLVHGVSTHQYIVGKPITDGDKLEMAIDQWTGRLSDFVEWVNGYEDLKGKPLYLTEYGDYDNVCPYPIPDPPDPLPEGCGTEEEGYAFFGDDYQKGFWAVIHHTTEYWLPGNREPWLMENASSQWVGVWWFHLGNSPGQAWRGGLQNEPGIPNMNGEHYQDTLHCFINGLFCPPIP